MDGAGWNGRISNTAGGDGFVGGIVLDENNEEHKWECRGSLGRVWFPWIWPQASVPAVLQRPPGLFTL
jgi:hypothetical protein